LGGPDFLEEVPLADQPAGLADEELDQLPFGGGEADLSAAPGDLLGGQVDAKIWGLHHWGLLVGWGGPAHGGPEAG
jgi:hypothetical protein